MLNNRILVIGLDRNHLELLSQVRNDYIFIHLDHPSKYRRANHAYEGLIFEDRLLLGMGDILNDFKSRPIFGIGTGPMLDGILWLTPPLRRDGVEQFLLNIMGTLRPPPANTGVIEVGTIVKNKTFSSWSVGVVKKVLEDDLYFVNFPQAAKITGQENHVCHKTTLRIICSMKELTNETN